MKKILTFTAVAVLSSALFSSCSKNEAPVFDDSKAFISFSTTSASVKENGDSVILSVSLASVAGLEGAATFKVVPDTITTEGGQKLYPIEGVNYTISPAGGTLRFDSNNRTQNIVVKGVPDGIYTGDMSLNINLSSQTQNLGYARTCNVTITDVDHPLTFILGSYSVDAPKAYRAVPYTMNIVKDAKDTKKVWFYNIFNYSGLAAYGNAMIYGIVSDDKTTISVPLKQDTEIDMGTGTIVIYGMSAPFAQATDSDIIESGKLEISIVQDEGKPVSLEFDPSIGFYVADDTYYYCYVDPGITATKE